MGELKQIYLLIQKDISKDNVKAALFTFNMYYNKIKDIKGFQNFTVSVISTLAQKLQSELVSTDQKVLPCKNVSHVIQLAECCFKILILSELQPLQNSLYVIVRYLLLNNHVTEAVHLSNYLLSNKSPTCDILKHLVHLFVHYIHQICPIDDHLKKLNVIMMWDAVLNLVKCYSGKEIEFTLSSLTMLVKNINGSILHEGRSMDLVMLDMTLESVLSSSIFRKKSNQENMMNLYSMLIENIASVMQNMMRNKQMHVHFLIKHIELMIDVGSLDKTEKEALTFFISFLKFIDTSIKNGLDSNFELRKMVKFIKKFKPTTIILPNTVLHHVFKATINTITKLKNVWYDGLIINSPEAVSQMFVLLQYLIDLGKYGSIGQMCCKSKDCDLNEDSTSEISLINIVFIMVRHMNCKYNTFLNLDDVSKWMELFTLLFKRVCSSNCSNKIPFVEFSLTSAYNLCIFTTSDKITDICLDFLDNLCLIFDPIGIDPDLVARVTILLSRYLYSKNKNLEALRCMAYWCVRTGSELTAQQWVYLKCKEEIKNHTTNQTILKMFKNDVELKKKWPEYSIKESDYIEIMWLELKAHNLKAKIKNDTSTILELFEGLLSHQLPREFKCRVIITTAYVLLHSSSINGLKTVIGVLEDFISKLELEISMTNKRMSLMLGNLYYANFMCLLKHLQNLVCNELDSYTEERLERGMEHKNGVQYEPMSWILPLKIKPKLFNCLNRAVENWSDLLNDKIKDEYDVQTLYKSLQEVAYIFKLHCDAKEIEVWQLLHKLASNWKSQRYIFIALSELIKLGKLDVLELDNLVKQLPKMDIDYKLALATSLLNQSKFKDAEVILENIDDEDLNKNILMMAEHSYLKSRLCFESGKFNENDGLQIFLKAYNLAHSLIKKLDSFYEYLVMHFVILNIFSYLNLICINTLKPVEARCFLKLQMSIVLKSVLTKRALNVFIMNCWNELMCCKLENVYKQLEHVMILLNFKEDELDSKMQKLTVSHPSNVISSPLSDYRCIPCPRTHKIESPSLKRLNNESTQMSILEFCDDAITNNKTHDPIISYSVVETCIIKAVYCSKLNQQIMAKNYFKYVFKLLELPYPQFNKNEVYHILMARQNSLAKYHYAKYLILTKNSFNTLDFIQKAKGSCQDEWILLFMRELCVSSKINNIMSYSNLNVVQSPVAEVGKREYKTPAISTKRLNAKLPVTTRYVTPAVRKLKMTLESPKSRENKTKSSIKKDTTVKKKIGKENIVKSTVKQESEIKVGEKRSKIKRETSEQAQLVIKKRHNRLNI